MRIELSKYKSANHPLDDSKATEDDSSNAVRLINMEEIASDYILP